MALCNEELQYLSANGGDQITAQLWRDDAVTPRGLLQIVHGMNEYMGRYEDFAAFMAASGFIVFGNDHTGHGKSKGAGGYGYFADKDGPGVLVKDVRTLNETVTHRYPQLPCFMLGHSLGSFICRSYITKYGDELAGIIISGTAGPNPLGGIGMVLSRLIIALRGPGYRSTMLIKMAFGNYNKRYGESRTQYDWLTRDTAIVDKYASDERCNFIFTARGFYDIAALLGEISSKQWATTVPKEKPYLMFSGAMDPVGDYGKGVQMVYDRMKAAGVRDITLRLYEEGHHEMLNELNHGEVYADVLGWMEGVLQKQGAAAQSEAHAL